MADERKLIYHERQKLQFCLLHALNNLFQAGMHIYARASAKGKRVQSNMGAKNHSIVMSDASLDATLNALVAAGFGAAGQRCMALSTVVFVGDPKEWETELVKRAKSFKVELKVVLDCCLMDQWVHINTDEKIHSPTIKRPPGRP